MPEGPDGKTIIIVKKVSGHGGHHGGAWKVAYADFVTAMMALFMVLWLVNSASTPTKEKIASYFRRPGIFLEGSGTPLEFGGAGILEDAYSPPGRYDATQTDDRKIYDAGPLDQEQKNHLTEVTGISQGGSDPNSVTEAINAAVAQEKKEFDETRGEIERFVKEAKNADDKKNGIEGIIGDVQVTVDQRGLHLEIMDTEKASMFERGSAKVKTEGEQELLKIADILVKLPNPIDIEGHTDAVPYRAGPSTVYDNWNLSVDRANAARRVLQKSLLRDGQIARVVGYSSQRLRKPETPTDASNRRISISMRFSEQAAAALQDTLAVETRSQPIKKDGATEGEGTKTIVTVTDDKNKKDPAAPNTPAEKPADPAAQSSAPTEQPAPHSNAVDQSTTAALPNGLQIELKTVQPEGTPIRSHGDEQSVPAWMEKDKIFGNENPFVVR
jgi:chemotaxis protein MotB